MISVRDVKRVKISNRTELVKKRGLHILKILSLSVVLIIGCIGVEQIKSVWVRENVVTADKTEADEISDDKYVLSDVKLFENESVVCYEDRAFYRFTYDSEQTDNTVSIVSNLLSQCNRLKVYVMPMTPRITVEEGYVADKDSYDRFMESLKEALPEDGVLIDASQELSMHREEGVFFRTECGWNGKGAYYGVKTFLGYTDRECMPLNAYNLYTGSEFKGSIELDRDVEKAVEGAKTGGEGLYEEVNRIEYYSLPGKKQLATIMRVYDVGTVKTYKKPLFSPSLVNMSSVIDSNYARAIVEGESVDGRNKDNHLLVICDTAGKCVVPFLKDYYDGIYVINIHQDDRFYHDIEQIMDEYNINEVLWIQTAEQYGKKGYFRALEEWTGGSL